MGAKFEAKTSDFKNIIKNNNESEKTPTIYKGRVNSGPRWATINDDVISGLKQLESESVNCIVTSPPYWWQRDYGVEGQMGHEDTIEGYVESLRKTFSEAKRVLNETGVLFLNIGDTYYNAKGQPHGKDDKHQGRQLARETLRAVDGPGLNLPRKSLIGMPWRVALALQEDGWTLRNRIVWERPAPMPEPSAHDRPWRTSEFIFLFAKDEHYWFDRDGLEDEEDIWKISARPDNPGSHFAPYPRELVRKCLACGCPPEGIVLDPFVGSGTTTIEALQKGNDVVGIDLKKEYCEFISSRIEEEFKQPELF
jgi:DNA modification methylase